MSEPRPWPDPLSALLLTGLVWCLVPILATLAMLWTTLTAALGLGVTLGVGGVAWLVASRVPPPQAERVGLRGIPARFALPLLLLVPAVFLTSEVDNLVQGWWPPPDAVELAERVRTRVPTDTPLALVETLVVVAGLAPIAEEWFFRGILQQGLVARFGSARGVAFTAGLFALSHGALGMSAPAWLALVAATFAAGLVLGVVRLATGSLLASMLLHAAHNALGIAALALAERVPIESFNVPGSHAPAHVLGPAVLSVAVGFGLLARAARRAPPDPGTDTPDEA